LQLGVGLWKDARDTARLAAPDDSGIVSERFGAVRSSVAQAHGDTPSQVRERAAQIAREHNYYGALYAALHACVDNHCRNAALHCSTCSPARDLLASISKEVIA